MTDAHRLVFIGVKILSHNTDLNTRSACRGLPVYHLKVQYINNNNISIIIPITMLNDPYNTVHFDIILVVFRIIHVPTATAIAESCTVLKIH